MPLQDSDNFIIGRGKDSYKITYQDLKDDLNYVPPPVGTIDQPTVLEPNDGAGGGDTRYLKSDAITDVEGGGVSTCETDTIESVAGLFLLNIHEPAAGSPPKNPTTMTGWQQLEYGVGLPGLGVGFSYADFGQEVTPTFMCGTSSSPLRQGLAYWDGAKWTVDVITNGDISNPTYYLNAVTPARYWYAFRDDTINVGDTLNRAPTGTAFNVVDARDFLWGAEPNIVLTFPSSNGFDCFPPGTVVQNNALQTGEIFSDYYKSKPQYPNFGTENVGANKQSFNGLFDKQPGYFSDLNGAYPCIWEPPVPIDFQDSVVVYDGVMNQKYRFNEDSNVVFEVLSNDKTIPYTLATGPGQLRKISIERNSTTTHGFIALVIDGKILIDPEFSATAYEVKVVSQDKDAVPPTITVDGGTWTTSDKLSKDTPYDTTLTVAGSTDLANMTGSVFSTDGTGAPGPYSQTPYKLTTTDIESVTDPSTITQYEYRAARGSGTVANVFKSWNDAEASEIVDLGSRPTDNVNNTFYYIGFAEGISQIEIERNGTATNYEAWLYGTNDPNAGSDSTLSGWTKLDYKYTWGGAAGNLDYQGAVYKYFFFCQSNAGTNPVGEDNLAAAPLFTGQTPANFGIPAAFVPTDVVLTFSGDVSTNPDLQYFLPGDEVGPNRIWSSTEYCVSGAEGNGAYNSTRAFNGETIGEEIWYAPNGGPVAKFDTGQLFLDAERIEINYASNGSAYLKINGIDVTPAAGAGTFEYPLVQGFRNLEFNYPSSGNYFGICWIKIDGVLLEDAEPNKVISTDLVNNTMVVDGGSWNTADDIDYVTNSTTYGNITNGTIANVFDGSTTTELAFRADSSGINISPSITVVGGLEIYGRAEAGATWEVNGTDTGNAASAWPYSGWSTITGLTFPFELTSVGLTGATSDDGGRLAAIRVNGTIITTAEPGETKVEYQTKGGNGTIVSVNTTDNTITLTDTGDRDNRWIKGLSVAGPSVIDEPLLTNDVELRSSGFATTPPGMDTLKEIIWSINDTEYSAGVTNPWSPLEKLPTNSTVTVKVKFKGNELEDSDWSPDVTFTTGATLRSLFTRIAALEANDVTDDATDTALLTLIAGLAARIQALEESN